MTTRMDLDSRCLAIEELRKGQDSLKDPSIIPNGAELYDCGCELREQAG